MFDKFGYSGIEFNPSANFARGHLIALRAVGGELKFDLCREGEVPAGVVHSVEEGQPLWTIFQESSFSMVKLGADVPVLGRLKCVGDGLAGEASPSDYSFGKTFAAGVSGQNVAVALQSHRGVVDGRYSGSVVLLDSNEISLRGGVGDRIHLPRPPAGHVYDSLEFDFLAGIGPISPELTRATWTGSRNYTHGRVVMNGDHDRPWTDNRSWYTSHWAGTGSRGTGKRILADVNAPEGAGTFDGRVVVGVVDRGLDTYLWNVQFTPRNRRLSFRQRGTSAQTENNTPLLLAALVTAVVVRE